MDAGCSANPNDGISALYRNKVTSSQCTLDSTVAEISMDESTRYQKDLLVSQNSLDAYNRYTYVLDAWLRLTPSEKNQIDVNVTIDPEQRRDATGAHQEAGSTTGPRLPSSACCCSKDSQ